MRVAVDARALRSGTRRRALGARRARRARRAHPEDDWLALVPGRAPVAALPAGVELGRAPRLPSRALHGAAALTRRPRVGRAGRRRRRGVDPGAGPVAPGAPYVLSVHDRSWEQRPGDFTRYERAWHALARPRALARHAAAVTAVTHAVAEDLRATWRVDAHVVVPGRRARDRRRAPRPAAICSGSARSSRARRPP